jgi:hypothetical protein
MEVMKIEVDSTLLRDIRRGQLEAESQVHMERERT